MEQKSIYLKNDCDKIYNSIRMKIASKNNWNSDIDKQILRNLKRYSNSNKVKEFLFMNFA